jgi:site-specific DNA-methyltransferase (adenine-specific)
MKEHENILIFSEGTANYYPIKEERKGSGLARVKYEFNPSNTGKRDTYNNMELTKDKTKSKQDDLRFPSSIQKFNTEVGFHPTQKPVTLMEYLINTYTKEKEVILDFTCGSGSTLVVAKNLNRKCIGIELEEKYCEIAKNRLTA